MDGIPAFSPTPPNVQITAEWISHHAVFKMCGFTVSISYELLPVAWFGSVELAELRLLCHVVLEANERESRPQDWRGDRQVRHAHFLHVGFIVSGVSVQHNGGRCFYN